MDVPELKITIPSTIPDLSLLIANDIESPKLCIIETHGEIKGNKESAASYSKDLQEFCIAHQLIYIAYDPSNNGTYEDQPLDQVLFSSRVQNLTDIIQYVRDRYKCPVVLLGSSLGGLVSINAASDNPDDVVGMIINCGVVYPEETLEIIAGKDSFDNWEKDGFVNILDIKLPYHFLTNITSLNTASKLKSLSCPILWFHGDKDPLAPIEHIRKTSTENRNINLIEVKNGEHRFGPQLEEGKWESDVEAFLTSLSSE